MGVNNFEILLIDVTFYHYHNVTGIFIMLIKSAKKEYIRDR